MGINSSKNKEPSLLYQLYGKSNLNNLSMFGGKSKCRELITPTAVDFNEDTTNIKQLDDFLYKFSQLTKAVPYEEGVAESKNLELKSMHLGQFKLFFAELLFLTKHIQSNSITKVLYVGAAEGYHISKLADLFPDVLFDLWDPRKFDLEPRDNIKIYRQFFTDDRAEAYAADNDKILFMCDIRTLDIGKLKKENEGHKIDDLIMDDMTMQANWVKIIKPVYAYLKFRLPWFENYLSPYLPGTIYLQPYSPTSTEVRLMTNNYFEYVEYDSKEHDEKIAYFSFFIRFANNSCYSRWRHIFQKYHLRDCWDNAYALYVVDYYLREIHNIQSDDRVGELFMEILNFHTKKYGKKYDIVFDKRL